MPSWDFQQEEIIRNMCRERRSVYAISEAIGKNVSAVSRKIKRLGLVCIRNPHIKSRGIRKWTPFVSPEEVDEILE